MSKSPNTRSPKKGAPKGKSIPLTVPGYRASGISVGIKESGGKDLALIVSDRPASVAGVFTTSLVKASPVVLSEKIVKSGTSMGVVVNSGIANVFRGKEGMERARRTVSSAEKALNLPKGSILVASTGKIGGPLPVDLIESGMEGAVSSLRGTQPAWRDAAKAIMTTDLVPKYGVRKVPIGGKVVTILGIAKGSGMIAPDMATMLSFVFTDATIKAPLLRRLLRSSVQGSYNSVMVDNDTSTNDTVLLFANGASGSRELKPATPDCKRFASALDDLNLDLAQKMVRDGEGATKFVEICVKGARSDKYARAAGRTVASSMLVKTAFFGSDPNWGRIVAALGRAGIPFNPDRVDVAIGGIKVAVNGASAGNEVPAARVMKRRDIRIEIDLKGGRGSSTIWTTDLSYGYVKINAEYTT